MSLFDIGWQTYFLEKIILIFYDWDRAQYLRAFTSRILKFLAFNNSKYYFIYFKTLFYNTPDIKGFLLAFNKLK